MEELWTKFMNNRLNDILVECDDGTYGMECAETCGKCVGNEPCDPVNGTCPKGCGPGYKGSICIESNSITLYLIIIHTYIHIYDRIL